MSFTQVVMNALLNRGHNVETVAAPLNNMFILDNSWLVEMDYDGAFAATITNVNSLNTENDNSHTMVVFKLNQSGDYETIERTIYEKIKSTIGAF